MKEMKITIIDFFFPVLREIFASFHEGERADVQQERRGFQF